MSPSRLIRTWSPWVSTTEASVSWGSPSRSASIAGTTLIEPSVEAMPHMTRSYGAVTPAFSTALASTSEVAIASEPAIASSTTWTPWSAPICSALRTASTACSGPTHSAVTVDVVGVLGLLLDLQRLLDGVLVELGQQPVDAHAVDGLVVLEVPVAGGVRHVLHTDSDLHGRDGPPVSESSSGVLVTLQGRARALELRPRWHPSQ